MADLDTWDPRNVAELAHQALEKLEALEVELNALREQVDACRGDRRTLLTHWRQMTVLNEALAVKIGALEHKAGER